jgi:hypothetical protein
MMPSNVTQPLYDGESLSFPEFAARTAHMVGPWVAYDRDAPLGAPLPDSFESSSDDYREKWFQESALELARVASWTPEEANQHAHSRNLSMLKSHLQSVRAARIQQKRYEFMSAQVAAWQPPTEEHEAMRTAMQRQLDETFGFYLRLDHKAPTKVTGEKYREETLHFLAVKVVRDFAELDVNRARIEQDSEFAKVFKDSLQDWQDVEVPQRELP